MEIASYTLHVTKASFGIERIIWVYDKDEVVRGKFNFIPDGEEYTGRMISSLNNQAGDAYVRCFMHTKDYSDVVDLLRNEKPIYLYYSPEDEPGGYVVITTGDKEIVGENEFRRFF